MNDDMPYDRTQGQGRETPQVLISLIFCIFKSIYHYLQTAHKQLLILKLEDDI